MKPPCKDVKALNHLEKMGGVSAIVAKSYLKFEIVPIRNGSRIMATFDFYQLDDLAKGFVEAALSSPDAKISMEKELVSGSVVLHGVYVRDVGENYLSDHRLFLDAKKHVSSLLKKALNKQMHDLTESVSGTVFATNPFGDSSTPSAVSRFISRVKSEMGFSM